MEKDAINRINAINRNDIGTNVVYWPILYKNGLIFHKYGKRTKICHKAYIDNAGQPLIHVEGVPGGVHIDHIEIGSLLERDSPCFDKKFDHRW